MLSKTSLGIAAGGAAVAFVGYCIYFDRKRRSDPNFKAKLRERRRKARETKASSKRSDIPDIRDNEATQRFFLSEVQLGEELLAQGQIDESVEHLSNAVAVCGNPSQLLQVLQQTLPPQVFQLLMTRLPQANMRIATSQMARNGAEGDTAEVTELPSGGITKSMLEEEMD